MSDGTLGENCPIGKQEVRNLSHPQNVGQNPLEVLAFAEARLNPLLGTFAADRDELAALSERTNMFATAP